MKLKYSKIDIFILYLSDDSVFLAKESCTDTLDLDSRVININAAEFQKISEKLSQDEIDDCTWTITTSVIGSLNLNISEFRYDIPATEAPTTTKKQPSFDFFDWDSMIVEDSFGRKKRMFETPCDITFIEIFDGLNENSPRIGGKICGNLESHIINTTSNNVFIKFSFKSGSSFDALKIKFTLASTLISVIISM